MADKGSALAVPNVEAAADRTFKIVITTPPDSPPIPVRNLGNLEREDAIQMYGFIIGSVSQRQEREDVNITRHFRFELIDGDDNCIQRRNILNMVVHD
eukprot:m.259317 g.259317  ORF g.259317 m.259317 type:complete len:98 (+) comp26635_c0_seq27:55-348(+)